MSLRDEIQAEIAEAFNEDLADTVHTFTCERVSKTNWDPKTETSIEVKENYSGRGVLFGSYSQYEVQALGVLATDKKASILQNEVTMIPKIDDEWITALGFFRVIHIQQDPASTIWKCQLRKI
ncbi:glutamate 5-kinase [Acinetobacter pittii]|uniref:glutamate 5-kinase n=1 Tax=Acinetobacter pittii TaxID=48296 RepID=UPI001F052FD5|nr:glutamate 5-kinase [Acinetobacter pittii]MCH2072956.1 glutamate 5-kinase [Acinetobacter pittii]